jgi:hypothetical protein
MPAAGAGQMLPEAAAELVLNVCAHGTIIAAHVSAGTLMVTLVVKLCVLTIPALQVVAVVQCGLKAITTVMLPHVALTEPAVKDHTQADLVFQVVV